jgi:predicted nucleic acid-binding protein
MRDLLDTNIVSDLVRNSEGRTVQHIREATAARAKIGCASRER